MTSLRLLAVALAISASSVSAAELRGTILDADTGGPIPARLYIQSQSGEWFFARSTSPEGSALEYRKKPTPLSVEMHTSLSAHPFTADLPTGVYTITAERGKEYLTAEQSVTVSDRPVEVTIKLQRWTHMSERGWYSGDTHNHIPLADTPNRMLAEDLNVALPITAWVTDSTHSPKTNNKAPGPPPEAKLIEVAPGHVIWPVNTEYEIFSVAGKQHTLGAMLIAGHTESLDPSAPPVGPIAELAHRQGGLIDLDKQNWPWSMMLVPIAKVDLYELSNNHIWRTNFHFKNWYDSFAPAYMKIDRDTQGLFTERGWIDFGFQNYYALLDCGFRLRPTAGTASGVHPVPLGFGRVYVHLPGGFDYRKWMEGLNAGRSFVTTGPMLEVTFNGEDPGHTFTNTSRVRVEGAASSAEPLTRIELVVNGEVAQTVKPENHRLPQGGYTSRIVSDLRFDASSWVAVRCFEGRAGGRVRFAHTAPVHVDIAAKPLLPRRAEVEYLVQRVEEEVARNRGVVSPEAMAEFEEALRVYRGLLAKSR